MDAASRSSSVTGHKAFSIASDYTRENTGFTHKSADQLCWNSQYQEYTEPNGIRLNIEGESKQGTFITLSTGSDTELDGRPSSAVSRPSSTISKQDLITSITPRDSVSSRTSFSVPSVGDC